MKRFTPQEIDAMLSGQLNPQEVAAIQSTGIAENDTLKKARARVFAERLYALMFHWIHLFDGTANPKVVEATDMCASWPSIRISSLVENDSEDFTDPTTVRLKGFPQQNALRPSESLALIFRHPGWLKNCGASLASPVSRFERLTFESPGFAGGLLLPEYLEVICHAGTVHLGRRWQSFVP
jgi:hypothetical protein